MASSFDIKTLNKYYNKKIAEEFANNSYAHVVDEMSKATGLDKEAVSMAL